MINPKCPNGRWVDLAGKDHVDTFLRMLNLSPGSPQWQVNISTRESLKMGGYQSARSAGWGEHHKICEIWWGSDVFFSKRSKEWRESGNSFHTKIKRKGNQACRDSTKSCQGPYQDISGIFRNIFNVVTIIPNTSWHDPDPFPLFC